MAEKKSWRDYSKYYSNDKDTDDSSVSKNTGSWREYSSYYSGGKGTNGTSGSWRDYSSTNPASITGSNIVNRVNKWLTNHNTFISDYQKRYEGRKYSYEDAYVSDSASWLDSVNKQKSDLATEADSILSFIDQNKSYLDEDWITEIKNTLNNAKHSQYRIAQSATTDNEWWSGFGTEELVKQFGSAEDAYKYHQDYDEKRKADLNAISKEIEDLGNLYDQSYTIDLWYDEYKRGYAPYDAQKLEAYNRFMNEYGGDAKALKKAYDQKEAYLSDAKRIQESDRLAQEWGRYTNEADFEEYAAIGAAIENPSYSEAQGSSIGPWRWGNKDVGNIVTFSRDNYNDIATYSEGGRYDVVGNLLYNNMTEDEVKLYNYLLAKEGKEKADSYLAYLKPQLESEEGKRIANAITSIDIPVLEDLAVLTTGFVGGIDQWARNTGSFFTGEEASPSITQYTNANLSNSLDGIGYYAHQAATTVGNMAPSILVSTVLGGAGLSTALAQGTGAATMGVSAAGGAYSDALEKGYDKVSARVYSTLVGASEGTLQYLIGGIGKLGGISGKLGGITGNLAGKVAAIDSSLLRVAAKLGLKGLNLGINIGSEIIEEEAQNYLEPVFRSIIFGEEYDAPTMDELIETAIVTALSTGALEGGSTSKEVNQEIDLNMDAVKKYGDKTDALVQEGLLNDVNSESYKLAQEYKKKAESGKSLNGYEIRQLLAANQDQITEKDIQKIQKAAAKRLTDLGQTRDVGRVAELATKRATGQKLTKAEKTFLANSQYGARVANELLPENIISGDYSTEWAEGIGTKQVNKLAYNIKNILAEMANMNNPATYKSLEDRVSEEDKLSVSENGTATISKSGDTINLSKPEIVEFVRDKETGKVTDMVLNVDGKKVKASEIDYADADQSYLFSAVKSIENITPGDATAIIRDYDPSSGLSVGEYLNGIDEAFTYGYHNYSEADMGAGLFTPKLSKEQAKGAYLLGQATRNRSDTNKSEAIKRMRTAVEAETEKAAAEGKPAPKGKKMTITYNEGGGKIVAFDKAGIELTEKQGAGVEVAKILHKLGLGTNFEFFASKESDTLTVKDKKTGEVKKARVFINDAGLEEAAPAGVYRKSDGTIRIDLNAYNGRELTLNALAHELTHFIQQWSDKKYKVLVDFLMKTYESTDMTMHQRVLAEQARLKDIRGEDVSYNEAYDEVVAKAMMKMFNDGKLVERLTELKAQDKDLAHKLWEGFKKILAKFLAIYDSNDVLYKDSDDLVKMKDAFEQLQNMFAEALVEASENYQAYLTASESQILTEAGFGFDESTKSMYSLDFSTAYKDEIQVGKKTFDAEAIAQLASKVTGRSIEDARKWVNSEMTIANIVMQNPEFLDFEADNRYEAIKKNSDYPQGTVDLSNLCPKREEFTTMFDMLQKKYPNKLFTAQDVADMRKILSDNGITVACGACFVEDRRQLLGEIADTYINMWKEAVESGKPLQKTNAAGVKSDLLVTKALAKQYGLTPGTKIMATDTYIPNQYDLTTYEGFKLLEKNHPTIAMGFNRYNNSRGQQSARLIEGRAEYNRQILGWSDAKVRSVNNNGGLRIFSFSDFEVVHLLDLVQVIIDCAAKGVKIQGYTKIPAFAKLVRGTGIKLNRSLIPKGDYGFHMENGKVVLDYDTTEGIDINDDNFIDDRSDPDIGNIVIGINPTQIGAAMLDPFIDYIIPFHSNKAKEILKKLGTGEWVNYKESQHEKDISTGKASKHNVNIYTEVINKYHPKNKVEFVEAFLKECKRQGKIPRYAEFLNVDANGDYAYREGYHKLLVDFKMFDKEGNILPQGNITPNLDENFMKDLLNAEIDKKQNYEFPQEVYDAIDKKFGEQYSSQETDLDYDKPIELSDVFTLRSIGRKSVSQFEAEDIQKAQKWAYKYFKDIGVKSPFFRAWFGDWRAIDKTPIEIVPIPKVIGKDDFKKFVKTQRGTIANKDTAKDGYDGWQIRISSDGENNTKAHAGGAGLSVEALTAIKSLVENSILLDTEVHEHHSNNSKSEETDRIAFDHKLYSLGMTEDDRVAIYRITIEEKYQDKKHPHDLRFHNLKYIEKVADFVPGLTYAKLRSADTFRDKSTTVYSVSDLYEFVKKYDGEFHAGEIPSAEMVGEDGLPVLLYHGTQGKFTIFDLGMGRFGIYLTANKQLASSYGANIMEVYASIKKPKYIDAGHALANTMDMSKIAREAEAEGYDGLIITNLVHAGNANYEAALRELAPEAMKEKETAEAAINQINESTGYLDKIYDITESEYSIPSMPLLTEPNLLFWAQKESDLMYDNRVSKQLAKLEPIQKEIAPYVAQYNQAVEAIRKAEKENASSISDTVYVAFKSGQVKDAQNNIGTFDGNNPDTLFSTQETDADNAPIFYSQMGKVVESMKQEKFGASSVISMLRDPKRGVKAEEIRWSGIQAFLDGKKSVTKKELLDFINSSMLQIEEDQRGSTDNVQKEFVQAWRNFIDQDLNETEILDGLNNLDEMESYLESLVEDEDLDRYYADYILELAKKADKHTGKPTKWDEYKLDGGSNYRELVFKLPGATYTNIAMQGHWGIDAQGVLAHARMQDFDTEDGKMLFIEEIQSDWHNQGQKEGYRKEGEKTESMLRAESKKAYEKFYTAVEKMLEDNADWEDDNAIYYAHPVVVAEMFDGNESYFDQYGFTDEQKETIRAMVAEESARQEALKTAPKQEMAPDAPFKDNYHEFVLKRILRMAAEQGYDSIGWSTADLQMDRWNPGRGTNETMGVKDAKNPDAIAFEEAYKNLYDRKMRKFLEKYGNQWGSTVGKTDIQTKQLNQRQEADVNRVADILEDPEGYIRDQKGIKEVWSMAITDAMKKSVLKEGQAMYSTQETDNISNRELLANAFEWVVKDSEEYKLIQEYKGHIKLLNEYEEKLSKLNAEIRKITFGTEGERDSKKLKELQTEAKKVAGNINRHDKKLLSLEASEPLRKVIERERKAEAKKTKDHVKELLKNKKVRAEQTELRHKIRKAVRDLDKLLNRGNKKQNVKEDMKGVVSKALELADYIFTDHVSNDELIRRGITVRMTPKEAALVKETEDILSQLYDNADSLTDEEFTRLDAKRKSNLEKLRDLLTSQRNERLQTPVYNLFNDLVSEYASLKNSKQDSVRAAYNEELENSLRAFMSDDDRVKILKNMRVADMTTEELNWLYRAYTMVLTNVRDANKFHVKGMNETIEQVVGQIAGDFGSRKIPDKKFAIAVQKLVNKLGWDYEKLYYALDRIGSEAFTKLIMNIADSENTVMQDIMESVAYRDEIVKQYGFNNWDINKEIDKEFLDNTGKKFKLTLGQLMSLYAYSRRDGAWDHIEYGGFVFGEAALTNPRPADSYKLSKEQCEAITSLLTKEQKGYVEDMQKFLSETMGAKGNEVSMMLYGIKMFGEKNYFPIHIAGQFKAQAQESQAKQAAGFGSMSNAGFTHAQNPNAKAPFVLEGFNEVWSDHVNEMSRYHGTVPALEDLRRVMNRSTYSDSVAESQSIKQLMENHFGKEAVQYFDNLYREANSGAITDKLQDKSKRLLSLFRKNSVAYSLSVLIQQPASIVRAYDLINKKYFGFKGFGAITSGIAKAVSDKWTKAHTNAYNEMLKYAPGVTMAKEIGGFDTATGGSIRSYLLDTNKKFSQKWKTGTVAEKGKAVLDLVDDNAIANLPNLADKIAWIEIWNACKRETVATHKDLAPNSEEFMQAVGERFTEVIRATQVYDSIFAKSPMLKSKNLAVQYLVSFMNEPNTVANMAEKAVRDATKGDWKGGAKTAAVVIHSIIFTNALKSIIYAMRDDDEDETYIEKYIESVVGGMMDDFTAFNYIPLVKDAWSIAQGYDVERADMAIVADAVDALGKVIKNATTNKDDMTEEDLIEFDKKVTEANWKLVESIATFFGIPVKNIRREIKGVLDHARIASANAGQTTVQSVWDKVYESVIDSIPFMQSENTKQDKLYAAIIDGDQAYIDRLKNTYKDDSAYQSAVRKALRENDPRIHEAAQARYEGRTEEYKRIFREIQKEGKFSFDDIMSAINSEESAIKNKLEPDKVTSSYTASDFVESIVLGDPKSAQAIKQDIIDAKVANGKTQEEAEKKFAYNVSTGIRDAYTSGLLDEAGAEKMLMEYADKDEEEAASKVSYWAFCEEHPEYDLSESNVNDYKEFAEPAEITLDVFVQYINGTKGLTDIKDEWGDVEVTKREQVLEVIDSLPLTWEQKDALYLAADLAESKIWDVPW